MTSEFPRTRLMVDAALSEGAAVPLTEAQAHRLRAVLRLGPGAGLRLFNGRDGEWLARVVTLDRKGGAAEVAQRLRPPAPEGDLWLAFAPLKKDPLETLVTKATELGVARLLPVMTRYTSVSRVNTERLAAQAVEAAEQCERLTAPVIAEPVALRALLDAWPEGRVLIAAAEAGPARPLADVAVGLRGQAVGFLTGPEGGFAPEELDLLRNLPFVRPAGLGPRLLRAETAALAALSIWQALAGDGEGRPPRA